MQRRTFCVTCSAFLASPALCNSQDVEETFCASYFAPAQTGRPIDSVNWSELGFPKIRPMLDLVLPILNVGVAIEVSAESMIAQSGLFSSSRRIVVGMSNLSAETAPLFVITLLHEFGHWLQVNRQTSAETLKLAKNDPSNSIKIELHADYLSGFLLNFVDRRQERDARCPQNLDDFLGVVVPRETSCVYTPDLLRTGSVLSGMLDFRTLGQNATPGATHPTSDQRLSALFDGYSLGRTGLSGRQAFSEAAKKLEIDGLFRAPM